MCVLKWLEFAHDQHRLFSLCVVFGSNSQLNDPLMSFLFSELSIVLVIVIALFIGVVILGLGLIYLRR